MRGVCFLLRKIRALPRRHFPHDRWANAEIDREEEKRNTRRRCDSSSPARTWNYPRMGNTRGRLFADCFLRDRGTFTRELSFIFPTISRVTSLAEKSVPPLRKRTVDWKFPRYYSNLLLLLDQRESDTRYKRRHKIQSFPPTLQMLHYMFLSAKHISVLSRIAPNSQHFLPTHQISYSEMLRVRREVSSLIFISQSISPGLH